MKARLMAMGIPAVLVGGLFGGAFIWKANGMSGHSSWWDYIWPALLAFAFLAFAFGALIVGWKKLLWPLLAGLVAQIIGIIIFLSSEAFLKPSEMLPFTGGAVALVTLIVLLVWLVSFLRARSLERQILKGIGSEGADQQKVEQIRKDMLGALNLLKRAGAGRNAIYELPWFLVIGRSQAGKTIAIKNSELGLPVRKDWIKGVGGTHTCDWFFTNHLIFLDTPGAWVTDGANDEAQQYWKTLLKLLRKYRGRRPLDGLVVVVPADDLLSKTPEEIQEQAGNIREVIDLLYDELHFRFPIYLVVSKSDLVDGFVDFFRSVPAQRWHEIVGWSNPDPNVGDPAQLVVKGFRRLVGRLRAYRLEVLARIRSTSQARKLFFFPENFRRVERPLAHFVDVLFAEDPSHEAPVFRGFYFTSGTQGEGSPHGDSLSQLARNLGVRLVASGAEGKEEPKRSYFLRELFRHLVVGDEGLVARTAGHWWRRRRDTLFAAFLPASLAGCFLFFSFVSFLLNMGTYRNIESDVPQKVAAIRARGSDQKGPELLATLEDIDQIREYHRAMTSPLGIFRRLGMRRPGELKDETFRIFGEQFMNAVLVPTLQGTRETVLAKDDPLLYCNERVDAFYAVVWLRRGERAQDKNDLAAFAKTWKLSGDQAEEAAELFRQQFRYLLTNRATSPFASGTLLPEFSLKEAASKLADGCLGRGGGTSLEGYLDFQRACANSSGRESLEDCLEKLSGTLDYENEDRVKLQRQVETLKKSLFNLSKEDTEAEAGPAYDAIKNVDLGTHAGDTCLEKFNTEIATPLRAYVKDQKGLIEECKVKLEKASTKPKSMAASCVMEQKRDDESKMAKAMDEYAEKCKPSLGYQGLDPSMVFNFLREYRKCQALGSLCGSSQSPSPTPHPVPHPHGPPGPPRTPRPTFAYLIIPGRPTFTRQAWTTKKIDFQDQLDEAESSANGVRARAEVQTRVYEYADRYAAAWKGYLAGMGLKDHGDIPGWLKGLADTTEFDQALKPASEALLTDPPKNNELDAFGERLHTHLGAVGEFVAGKIPDYQSNLRKVASDLEACKNPQFWTHYKQTLNEPNNSIHEAKEWVLRNAGSSLAEGSLRSLLMKPVEVAENFVRSSTTLTERSWQDLRQAYEKVKDQAPFAGEKGSKVASEVDVKALLGGASGLVPRLNATADSSGFGKDAKDWLGKVAPLSSVFFGDEKDQLKPLKVTITQVETTFEPPALAEDWRLDEMSIDWGGGIYSTWTVDQPKSAPVDIHLFGDEASTYCFLTLIPSEKKRSGLLRKMGWEKAESRKIGPFSSAWAPFKLLAKGLPEGGALGGSDLRLTYSVPIPYKKDKDGKLIVSLHVSASNLGRVLQLAQNGILPPPERP